MCLVFIISPEHHHVRTVTKILSLTSGQGQLRKAWPRGVDLTVGSRLAHHVAGHQMAVEDVPRGGDEAAAVTHPVQCVGVDFKVTLTVCFSGERRQTDETDKRTLACGGTVKRSQRVQANLIQLVNDGTLVVQIKP